MAVAEADWSELPKDLLNLILNRLDNEIDLIRFRSICSTWRSSTIPYHDHILPFKVPLLRYNKSSYCYLFKCSRFLIKPSPQQQQRQQQEQTLVHRPWLIQIAKKSTGKTKLLNPDLLPPFYFHSTHLDFIKLSVLHLGTHFIVDKKLRYGDIYRFPKKIVAVTPFILAILFYDDRNLLVLLRCGDERWTEIPDIPSSIGDICVFKGQLYAVEECSSRIVKVAPEDLSVQLVAKDVFGGDDTKFLVESEGELLLVEVCESCYFYLVNKDALNTIHVFRLDENEKKWVKLSSLGDRILFLGNECSFSASASDLYVAKGNCVIFMEDAFLNSHPCESGMCVFHLDQGRVSPLSDYPDYLNLFWPPPKWIIEGFMHKSKKSMLSYTERFLM
ncbi:hypothetical protein TSUD_121480 [Trifolium subterraneum]|nr:hypothetical protein TSUD_121480 [Trifolium subterraneum]